MFTPRLTTLLPTLILSLTTSTAIACGGFFPQEPQAVSLGADRVLYVPDGEQTHVIAQVTWAGEPSEFAWLLPVPADAEARLSTQDLFYWLDHRFGAEFTVANDYQPGCEEWTGYFDGGVEPGGRQGGVEILTHEALGPYEQTLIKAESADELIGWLTARGYAAPEGAADRLQPYVDEGLAVLALRLRPGADTHDLRPIHVSFSGQRMGMHLRLSAVGANPDTGIMVHTLGEARAVPTEPYLHVEINEALIDWGADGGNYLDVVAEAADEAGGLAFATDFAGPSGRYPDPPLDEGTLAHIAEVSDLGGALVPFASDRIGADLLRLLRPALILPAELTVEEVLDCLDCYPSLSVDGAGLAESLRAEYNPPRALLVELFERHPYMTRMVTVISPDEMQADPRFVFNAELPEVAHERVAVRAVTCDGASADYDGALWTLPDGRRFEGGLPLPLYRDGEARTEPGAPAAWRVHRMGAEGEPELVSDNSEAVGAPMNGEGGEGGAGGGTSGSDSVGGSERGDDTAGQTPGEGSDDGCACRASSAQGSGVSLLALLGVLLMRPRRRWRGDPMGHERHPPRGWVLSWSTSSTTAAASGRCARRSASGW